MRLLKPGKMPLNELQRKLGDSHLSPNLGLLVSYRPLAGLPPGPQGLRPLVLAP